LKENGYERHGMTFVKSFNSGNTAAFEFQKSQKSTEFRTYGAAAELLIAYREQPRLRVHRCRVARG